MNEVFSVSDFVTYLNQTLSYAYPSVVIEGEVSSFKVNQGKWVFFDLKDDEASVGCFMSVYQLKVPLEDGMQIRVVATPKLTNWGKFSLTVKEIELTGEGTLKRAYELLRQKFETEGLFAEEAKQSLPEYPERIALITSEQAAAFNDFVTIAGDRWPILSADLYHVQVQGMGAVDQIAAAITQANSSGVAYDAIVLIRGGGSLEDLAAFSSEPVVRAVFGSRIPIIVAVGHEDDISLAELAADKRGATPTDAARLLTPDRQNVEYYLSSQIGVMSRAVEVMLTRGRELIAQYRFVSHTFFERNVLVLDQLQARLTRGLDVHFDRAVRTLVNISDKLQLLNPKAVLSRGYSIAMVGGRVVTKASQIGRTDTVVLQLHQGKVNLRKKS